jgi:mannose-6-phosphate isomerase
MKPDSPLRLEPFLRPMVWGGRRLESTLGKRLPGREPYGESWEVSDHPLHRSVIASGAWVGRNLRELMENERAALLGAAAERCRVFPWLIKFLDARDWLSVQVHPDERAVRELLPGEGSKTEAWFVLDTQPGSLIYAGLLPGTDEPKLRAALESGKVADCLHRFEPRAGDCVFLPAGTVHAVGGGVLMAEVQETSDATFRLFDWNRRDAQGKSRSLHFRESLAAIHWQRGPVHPLRVPEFGQNEGRITPRRLLLVDCPFFKLEYIQDDRALRLGGTGGPQAMIVVGGRGEWRTSHGPEETAAGQTWLLPASMPALECRPCTSLKLLLCSLPG